MDKPDIVERLGATRARIEAAVDGPTVLVVTSALPTDGSSLLASALAQSLIRAGHSVLLISSEANANARPGQNAGIQHLAPLRLPGGTNNEVAVLGLAMSGSRDLYSLESIRTALAEYRERFAFTVIDAPGALSSGSALSFARAADIVVVAFEDGRAAREADRELAKTLKVIGASVIGVVTLDPKTIARESKKRAPSALRAKAGVPAIPSPIG
jgi:receptor protein-tyrosine kinase